MAQHNLPKLRFPGFSGEWEEKKLSDVSIITTGNTPSTAILDYYGDEELFVSPADINSLRYITNTKTKLSKLGFNKTRKILKGSTLFVSIGSTIGKVAQAGKSCSTNQQINALTANAFNADDFIFSLLEHKGSKISLLAGTQAVPLLNKTDFSNIEFYFPTLPEQQKIASFLSATDKKIEQLQKKKELLGQYKKGMMQKLLSRKLRFKDDNGKDFPEWEYLFANKMFKNHSNKNHNGDLPILSASQIYGMISRDDNGIKIQASEASVKSYKIVEKGDFVISLRSFQGGIEYSDITGICSPAYIILKPTVKINTLFFKYYFKWDSFIERLSKTVVGIRDGKQITYDNFSSLKLPLISIKEQTKIANFLTAIDDKIALTDKQLEGAKTFKKGLLQQLFV